MINGNRSLEWVAVARLPGDAPHQRCLNANIDVLLPVDASATDS
jgi:hypothetical protein